MTDASERRVAHNESLFRESNEAIRRGLWPGEKRGPVRFRCECGDAECQAVIEIPLEQYGSVRENARRFVMLSGHEVPDVERVVDRQHRYLVVEKTGLGGEVAEALG